MGLGMNYLLEPGKFYIVVSVAMGGFRYTFDLITGKLQPGTIHYDDEPFLLLDISENMNRVKLKILNLDGAVVIISLYPSDTLKEWKP